MFRPNFLADLDQIWADFCIAFDQLWAELGQVLPMLVKFGKPLARFDDMWSGV